MALMKTCLMTKNLFLPGVDSFQRYFFEALHLAKVAYYFRILT